MLVVGNYSPDRQLSMLRFAETLVANLRVLGAEADLVAPQPIAAGIAGRSPWRTKLASYVDKILLFPPVLRRRARYYDCVHIVDHSNTSYARFAGDRPVLVTCHDLFAIQVMLGEADDPALRITGRLLQRSILTNLKRIRTVTCVSRHTRDEFVRIVGPAQQPHLIPNALSPFFRTIPKEEASMELAALGIDPGGAFFLHVGGNQFYKNRPGIVRLFSQLATDPRFADHRLVMAGKAPDAALAAALDASPIRDRIDVVIAVPDAGLRALYNGATALLFLSLTEGFGWPILEAQACGCPVVTTDAEPMRSVAGGAALLVDISDADAAARATVEGAERFDALRAAGFANVEGYRPETIYPAYIELYRSLLHFRAGSVGGAEAKPS